MNFKTYAAILAAFALIVVCALLIPHKEEPDGANVIKIGVIVPLTGSGAAYGKDTLRGIELAVAEAMEDHPSVKIELIIEDDKTSPAEAINAAQKLILTDKVRVIIGPVTSTSTLAVSGICEENQVICLSPGASNPKISNAGDYIFRNWISDDLEGKAMAQFMVKEEETISAGILYINNDYGIGLRNIFAEEFESLGGKIAFTLGYEQGQTDFKTIINKVKNQKVKAIYLPGYYKEMANIILESKRAALPVEFRSVVTFEEPELLKLTQGAEAGILYSSPFYEVDSTEEKISSFASAFESSYGRAPGIFAAHGYDAQKIIFTCLEKNDWSFSGLKELLYRLERYPGVSGETTFDENGDVIKSVAIKVATGSGFALKTVIENSD